MKPNTRYVVVLGALAVILVITAGWWALALWPTGDTTPAWLATTRSACFGSTASGLPNAGGWLVLVGQPLSMLLVLLAVWGGDVRAGLGWAAERVAGQLALGAVAAALVAGVLGVTLRVRVADAQPFATSGTEAIAIQLNRLNDKPKPLALVDQHGDTVTLARFIGRPVVITFAYANCHTVCPLVVHDVLTASAKLAAHRPVVLIVTLDPWRDTPSRLPSIVAQWGASGDDVHVLSGDPTTVERVLTDWRIPRVRNERTGDVSHPSLVYVVGADGHIVYVVQGAEPLIRAALEAL